MQQRLRRPPPPIVRGTLRVGPAGDRHERQAERVAGGSHHAHTHPSGPGSQGGVVDARTQRAIEGARGRGRALPEHVRAPLEAQLGADFRGVRLHTDAQADRLNRGLRSTAFTTGRDVFLRRGHTDVASPAGRQLIAHELTHVAQQAQAGSAPVIQRQLHQIGPDQLYDDQLGVTATRDTGFAHVFIDDRSGAEYEIGKATNGDPGFVPATVGFRMTGVPSGFNIAGTQGYTPPPAWNPGPRGAFWESPGRSTAFSDSPGGTTYERRKPRGPYGGDTRRNAAGYVNPKQFAVPMLPLWEDSVRPVGSMPGGLTNKQKVAHFKNPATQFEVYNSDRTQSKMITGYTKPGSTDSAVVLGHDPSAGAHFNAGGHQQPRGSNLAHNKTTGAYHGLEDYLWSAQSGAREPGYQSPRPDRGSHPSYYNRRSTGYTGGPWHSYRVVKPLKVINYIDSKLAGAAAAYATDPEYRRARMELLLLQSHYSQTDADDLLALIKKKGW